MAITKKSLMEELELMVRDDEISQETIIRLSKENKEYEKTIVAQDIILKALEKNINKLQDRIDKAIEHIETHQLCYQSQYEEMSGFDNHLLDILRGEDNE